MDLSSILGGLVCISGGTAIVLVLYFGRGAPSGSRSATGKFFILGYEFRIRDNDFRGPVVGCDEALFFVLKESVGPFLPASLSLGGVGLAGYFGSKAADTSYTGDLSQLPETVSHPEWPIRQRTGSVVLLARRAVTRVRIPSWLDNRVYVSTASLEVSVVYNLLRRSKVKRVLAEAGWL
jgi:hypothetical protein